MIRRIDLRETATDYRYALPRAAFDVEHALDVVRPICDDVQARGAEAVLDYAEKFDGVRPPSLRVPKQALDDALAGLDPRIRAGLEESITRLRLTCAAELERDVSTTVAGGAHVVRRIVPIRRVGLYVPGGLAPLVSSVIMNAVPAQVAGVASIALTSSPQAEFEGLPHPSILAACALLGIDEVYAAGGAQAIAMFAYGAGDCRPVDLVTGPGNIYVVAAKRLLKGRIAIDSEAGPTEIAIIADSHANPAFVAADLISQSEHDPLAASVLITDSQSLADEVDTQLFRQAAAAKHGERIRTSLTGDQSCAVLVADIDQAVDVANAYGAEHLEIHTADAPAVAARIHNAGAIFVGPYAPVSLGDYCAGSNHVLPTGGSAAHASGLSVRAFCKNMQVISYDESALRDVAAAVVTLAEAENLPAHGTAVTLRVTGPQANAPKTQQ